MNVVDSVVDRCESSGLARTSMNEASPTADGNPLGLGGSETKKEPALLDGSVNEGGQSNKEKDNRLGVRVGEASDSGGKISCSLKVLDIHLCIKAWTGRFRIGDL